MRIVQPQAAMMKMLCRTLLLLCTLPQFSIGYRQFSGMKAEFKVREEDKNKGYIYFMTIRQSGEMPRAVPSLCPPHWCSLSVDDEMWTGNKLTVIFSITLERPVEPLMVGELSFCWGGRNTFRLFPKTAMYYRKSLGKLTPSERVLEPFSVTPYTWFMERVHYDQLRLQGHTELLLPLLNDRIYSLPVQILIFHESSRSEVECTLGRPYTATALPVDLTKENGAHVIHIGRHLTRVMLRVGASQEKSGTYTVSCSGKYFYPLDNEWYPMQVEKSITLRFEKLPKIELVGHAANSIYFPHSNKTGEFLLDIYSTSDIATVDIARSDGVKRKRESELIPQYLEQHHYQLRAKYRINIPWLDAGITGTYTVKITNENGESAALEIKLHKVEELVVLVSPLKLEAEEGTSVSLYCLVLTDLPTNTTIYWEMTSPKELTESKKLEVTGERRAVELILASANLSQSGTYSCVADNGFQMVSADVGLTVFARGAPDHKRQWKATWVEKMNCDEVMDAATVDNVKTAGKIMVGLAVFCAVAALAAVATIAAWKVYQKMKEKGLFEATEAPSDAEGETQGESVWTSKVLTPLQSLLQTVLNLVKKRRDRNRAQNDEELDQLLENTETQKKKSPKAKGKQKQEEEKTVAGKGGKESKKDRETHKGHTNKKSPKPEPKKSSKSPRRK